MTTLNDCLNDCYYQSFVDPALCSKLVTAGIQVNTPFFWVVKGRFAEMYSYAFDRDKYYVQADANVNFISNLVKLPAYQLMDMQKLLPDFILSKHGDIYLLRIFKYFGMEAVSSPRMPDVFALMVLKCISINKIDLYEAIKLLKPTYAKTDSNDHAGADDQK